MTVGQLKNAMRQPSASLTRSTPERHDTKPRTDWDSAVGTKSKTAEARHQSSSPARAQVAHIRVQHVWVCPIHRHAKRSETVRTVTVVRGADVFLSSCGSPRWTATTDPRDMKSMHIVLCQFWNAVVMKYQNTQAYTKTGFLSNRLIELNLT